MEITKIVVHGAYRGDNFGDTLLLGLVCRELIQHGYGVSVSNTCSQSLRHLSDANLIERLVDAKEELGAVALVYGGGGYFGEQPIGRLRWNLRFIAKHLPIGFRFIRAGKPVVICGTDFGPLSFWPSRVLVKRLLRSVKYVGARNRESIDYITDLGIGMNNIHETADIALSLKELEIDEIDQSSEFVSKKRRVLIHPSFNVDESAEMLKIANIFRQLTHSDDLEVCLMADRSGSQVQDRLEKWASYLGLPADCIYKYQGPWKTCALIKASDAVITNKLHAAIVGSAYGKRVISIAKHPKNARYFKQIGRQELYMSLNQLDFDALHQLILNLISADLDPITISEGLLSKAKNNIKCMLNVIDTTCPSL